MELAELVFAGFGLKWTALSSMSLSLSASCLQERKKSQVPNPGDIGSLSNWEQETSVPQLDNAERSSKVTSEQP